jgi:hypothetical protein
MECVVSDQVDVLLALCCARAADEGAGIKK